MKSFLLFLIGVFTLVNFAEAQNVYVVEPDQGVLTNALPNAVAANGDGIYELRRGGEYFLEGSFIINNTITIRAEEGTGPRPKIIPVSDALGALPSDMIRMNNSVTFQNVYVTGRDIVTGINQPRIFRMDGPNMVLRFEGCFVEMVYNFCIRNDNTGNRLYIDNSTFRNLALTSDPANGRLMDTRGNAMKLISMTNSTIYNNTGNHIRFNDAITDSVVIKDNTFYNIGYQLRFNYAMSVVIQNNIFANNGWKATYGETAEPGAFFELYEFVESDVYKNADVRMTITNNNIFTSPEIKQLYTKYPLSHERLLTDSLFDAYIEKGQITFQNNIEEVLTFQNPSPLPMAYIDKYFEMNGTGMAEYASLPFYVDEDGNPDTMDPGANEYSFTYPISTASATASTTGGPIGAPRWYPESSNVDNVSFGDVKIYPNPVKDILKINLGEEAVQNTEIIIYNVLGSVVYRKQLEQGETSIDLKGLSSGIYTYKIFNGNKNKSGKLIKK